MCGSLILKTDGCGTALSPDDIIAAHLLPLYSPIINSRLFICCHPINQKPQKLLLQSRAKGVGLPQPQLADGDQRTSSKSRNSEELVLDLLLVSIKTLSRSLLLPDQ